MKTGLLISLGVTLLLFSGCGDGESPNTTSLDLNSSSDIDIEKLQQELEVAKREIVELLLPGTCPTYNGLDDYGSFSELWCHGEIIHDEILETTPVNDYTFRCDGEWSLEEPANYSYEFCKIVEDSNSSITG